MIRKMVIGSIIFGIVCTFLLSGCQDIDEITILESSDYIVLYPRARLDTYIGVPENDKIQFRAAAYHQDGTAIEDVVGFVFYGDGVDPRTGVFTPKSAGTIAIVVTLGERRASTSVTVHPADYMRRPYVYPGTGKTYAGFSGTEGRLTTRFGGVTVTYPSETTFNADGFFTLEGSVNNSEMHNYAYINVVQTNPPTYSVSTYFVRNHFKQRIWMRFGPGDYMIEVLGLTGHPGAFALDGEGDWIGRISMNMPGIIYNVTNTRTDDVSADPDIPDKRFLYPSYIVQSDNIRVTNIAAEVTYGLTDSTDKIRAINDYLVRNTVYDMASTTLEDRKKQDALTVLGTRYHQNTQYEPMGHFLAVCEGYSNTFAAIARAAGFETRYVSSQSMNHGWNHIFVNGSWKFMDITWNDPLPDRGPHADVFSFYFLLDNLNGLANSHTGWEVNQSRTLIDGLVPPWQRGVTDGWY